MPTIRAIRNRNGKHQFLSSRNPTQIAYQYTLQYLHHSVHPVIRWSKLRTDKTSSPCCTTKHVYKLLRKNQTENARIVTRDLQKQEVSWNFWGLSNDVLFSWNKDTGILISSRTVSKRPGSKMARFTNLLRISVENHRCIEGRGCVKRERERESLVKVKGVGSYRIASDPWNQVGGMRSGVERTRDRHALKISFPVAAPPLSY